MYSLVMRNGTFRFWGLTLTASFLLCVPPIIFFFSNVENEVRLRQSRIIAIHGKIETPVSVFQPTYDDLMRDPPLDDVESYYLNDKEFATGAFEKLSAWPPLPSYIPFVEGCFLNVRSSNEEDFRRADACTNNQEDLIWIFDYDPVVGARGMFLSASNVNCTRWGGPVVWGPWLLLMKNSSYAIPSGGDYKFVRGGIWVIVGNLSLLHDIWEAACGEGTMAHVRRRACLSKERYFGAGVNWKIEYELVPSRLAFLLQMEYLVTCKL